MHILYHLLRADFFERTRRYSYLIVLGLVLWLGYLCADGTLTLRLDDYRGVFNSAWVGAMMALVVNTFLGLFGFYVIKGSIERDRQTGVGQIIATTPLTRGQYLLGKWLSNFAVLGTMVIVLAAVAVGLQLWQGEAATFDGVALLMPFIFVSLPMMALIAALAVLFEVIPFLRGGLGNVIYFFTWNAIFVLSITVISTFNPALDPTGMSLFMTDMSAVLLKIDPAYAGGFSLGGSIGGPTVSFVWPGLNWTLALMVTRLGFVALALGLVALAALFFDRFADANYKVKARRADKAEAEAQSPTLPAPRRAVHLSPVRSGFNLFVILWAELKLALKGRRWWWYAIAVVCIIVPIAVDAEVLPAVSGLAYIWPLTVWSALGNREARFGTHQMVFAAPHPLLRQLPATWLVAVALSALSTLGVGANHWLAGHAEMFFTWSVGVFFIPTLALALGIWSGTPKAFEVVFVMLWYAGLLNNVAALNFASGPAATGVTFGVAALVLLVLAVVGRQRQLRLV